MTSLVAEPLTAHEAWLLATYRRDPVLFVQQELGFEPSEDQKKVLMDIADPNNKYIIISAGRGSGKTLVVSWIVAWSIACLQDTFEKYQAVILGGSKDQSEIMYQYFKDWIYKTPLLYKRVVGDPLASKTEFENGYVRAIPASDKQVRGRHIELLILDEVAGTEDDTVLSAMPMILGSHHGRIIMLSTPHRFYGVFQDRWENYEYYKYKRYGPWALTDCWWIDQEFVEQARKSYPPEKFAVEFEGKFPKQGANVLDPEDIKACIAKEPFGLNGNFDFDGGIDWGKYPNPTVFVRTQSIKKGKELLYYVPGPEMQWLGVNYPIVNREITAYCDRHRADEVFGDAYGKGENERLEEHGINCQSISFTKDEKNEMIENLQFMFHLRKFVISPDNTELIKQLHKYRYAEARKGPTHKTTEIKKDEDFVDALMLSVYSLKNTPWFKKVKDDFRLM